MTTFLRSAVPHAGFSVMEVALVLGISGTLLAGIWSAASAAWEYARRQEALDQITAIVTNVRGYYAGQLGVAPLAYTSLTAGLMQAGVIPAYVQRNPATGCTNPPGGAPLCADSPWGARNGTAVDPNGTLRVCNWTTGGGGTDCVAANAPAGVSQFFGVAVTGLRYGSCIALTGRVSNPAGPAGLVEVNINGTNIAAGGAPVQPVAASKLNALCKREDVSTVTFVYRLMAVVH